MENSASSVSAVQIAYKWFFRRVCFVVKVYVLNPFTTFTYSYIQFK